MKIVFRVDSGFHMGIGHVMRCLTLASELKKNNHEIIFIIKNHLGFDSELINKKFMTYVLEKGVRTDLSYESKKDYRNWLGETWQDDLIQTNKILTQIGLVDLVIVDHYALDESYERKLLASKVMVIDDLMNRDHYCDILLDQNITANNEAYKNFLIKKDARLLAGPQFALLRDEFKEKHLQVNIGDKNRIINSILIFFGASDVNGDCFKLANALSDEILKKYHITFILNSSHKDFKKLENKIQIYPNIHLMSFVDNLANLMMKTDLFIGAGGTTSWERSCLGVATAILSVADNQTLICEELGRRQVCLYLGPSLQMNNIKWLQFFEEIVPNNSLWYGYRSNSFNLIDGLGTSRVVAAIEEMFKC